MSYIVLVGGGFGGIYVAAGLKNYLKKHLQHTLTLISPKKTFVFTPLLHEVAAGIINPEAIQVNLKTLSSLPNYHFVQGTGTRLSLAEKAVVVGSKKIRYDLLVLATGAKAKTTKRTTLKTLADAMRIRRDLSKLPQTAHIGVVGGGPTGIELATEIAEQFAHVTVFQRREYILPSVGACFRKKVEHILAKKQITIITAAAVSETKHGLRVNTKEYKLDYVLWCIGVKPKKLLTDKNIYTPADTFIVENTLGVKGIDSVFALGDCAATGAPMLAQAAEQQARVVVQNIIATLEHKPLQRFTFHSRGFLLSVGKFTGVAQLGPFVFSGFFAWWLKRTIYVFKIIGLLPKCALAWEYTKKLFFRKSKQL